MSNNLDITINDFKNICRTCLSREDLKPLYEKCSQSTGLAEMLTSCTFVKFAEDDGLPVKICTNCINEIKQTFFFAKRCEASDAILRNCVIIKADLENISSQSPTVETIINKEEEMKIEIKPEIILPDMHRTVEEAEDYKSVKQEDVQINYDCPVDESYADEGQDKTYSEKSDNFYFGPSCSSTESQIQEESWKEEDIIPVEILNIYQNGEKEAKMQSRDFQCSECDLAFTEKRLLRRHYLIHLKNKFVCSVCGEGFVSKELLNSHSKVHTSVRPYACYVCGKSFTQVGYLNIHKLIHTGKKPHVCSVCNKAFLQTTGLKNHMRIHTGDKPFICTVCSDAFSHRTSLNRHLRIHTGEKPYSCEICERSFNTNAALSVHNRTHTGEKPNVCSVCNKAFTLTQNLKSHMRTHTGEKPYSCGVCSMAFAHHTGLKRHIIMFRHE